MPADSTQQELFQVACSEGRLDSLKTLLQQNSQLAQAMDEKGATALLLAATNGHLHIVQWLLTEGGSSITEKDTINGSTALLWAAYSGHLPTVQWLLTEGGASITERAIKGSTALMFAVSKGHLSTVQWLLTKGGANITERNTQGGTALLCAAFSGHLLMVQWLLTEGGASITEKTTHGVTALLCAASSGHLPTVQWLLASAKADICETNARSENALAYAMSNKQWETALFLYHYGKPRGMSIGCLSREKVNEFENLKLEEIGAVGVVSKAASAGALPWDLIKIINAYAFVCLSESEGVRIFDYGIAAQRFEDSRNRLQALGKAALFKSLFAKGTLVPARTIPAAADISALEKKLFKLQFLIDYTENPNVPLKSNPINALVQKQLTALQHDYLFLLKAVRAMAFLGAVAGVVAVVAAITLLTGVALAAFVTAGVVMVATSAYCFFKASKTIHQQSAPLPSP